MLLTTLATHDHPRLRALEAIPEPRGDRMVVRDPTHLASAALVVGPEQFLLLTLLDGRRHSEVRAAFARQVGQTLRAEELDALLDQLDRIGFLEGPGFEAFYAGLVREYQAAPFRPLRDRDNYGARAGELPDYLNDALAAAAEAQSGSTASRPSGRLAGIIAPHLDFPRGLPCYADSYYHVRAAEAPQRVVVLGTNHFGRSRSVVATDRDFQTPWGVLPTDRDFLDRLQATCGGNLLPHPLDHLHEHSIELHAIWLHCLLGDHVRIVPVLCPDPSGPRGTAPGDEGGVDLREFALALGELLRADPVPTLLVASADLSHVGRYFGDDLDLDPDYLSRVQDADETALAFVEASDPEGFREHMARTQNPTNICSVGCIYTLMVALGGDAQTRKLRYHQAVTTEAENAVTCTAFTFHS